MSDDTNALAGGNTYEAGVGARVRLIGAIKRIWRNELRLRLGQLGPVKLGVEPGNWPGPVQRPASERPIL